MHAQPTFQSRHLSKEDRILFFASSNLNYVNENVVLFKNKSGSVIQKTTDFRLISITGYAYRENSLFIQTFH